MQERRGGLEGHAALREDMSGPRTQHTGEDGCVVVRMTGRSFCGLLEHSNSWGGGGDIFRKP